MSAENELEIVGIGASAGGLNAIRELFEEMPMESGLAFVVVQHLSPDFKSFMPELLAKHTNLKIYTAEEGQKVISNCIYLNDRNKNLVIKGDTFHLLNRGPKERLNLPIDIFFHALGEEYGTRSSAVILSGTGSDGSKGIDTIKKNGGTVFVQNPITAQFDGMPNSAIATGFVDHVLTPEEIAKTLAQKTRLAGSLDPNQQVQEKTFTRILSSIFESSGVDFRLYKSNTLSRRLEKRMLEKNIKSIEEYEGFLKKNNEEKAKLVEDFFINVTSFFRDTSAFELLEKKIIPEIIENHDSDNDIRVWVPGCSTGEEAVSIAILLEEAIEKLGLEITYKIFGTDIDQKAIQIASKAEYPISAEKEIRSDFLKKYFDRTNDKLALDKSIRGNIIYSTNNILSDPPLVRMDLISCRNMLIYLGKPAQENALNHFNFSLNPKGFLFLGSSETLGNLSKRFKTIDTKWKIYQCQDKKSPTDFHKQNNLPYAKRLRSPDLRSLSPRNKNTSIVRSDNLFYRYLSQRFSPSAIFIDDNFDILFIRGDAGDKIIHNEGLFEKNLIKLVRPDLALAIRNGVRRLKKDEQDEQDVVIQNLQTQKGDETYVFDLHVHKPSVELGEGDIFLIHFGDEKKAEEPGIKIEYENTDNFHNQRILELESELRIAKQELQEVIEELETSNEELQSSNEELMASNEELQSTNEELQSVNEELHSVNVEMQEKNSELVNLHNDLSNLMDSSEIGTLFLDRKMKIRKFTPALKKVFDLETNDIGRTIKSFASSFSRNTQDSILKNSQDVFVTLHSKEYEVVDNNGRHFLIKINPFVTKMKKVEGIVISFVNITELVEKERILEENQDLFRSVFTNTDIGIVFYDMEKKTISANPRFIELIGYSEEELKKDSILNFTYQEDVELTREIYKALVEGKKETIKFEKRYTASDGRVIWAEVTAKYIENTSGRAPYILELINDVTKKKQIQQALQKEIKFSESIAEATPSGIYIYDVHKNKNVFMNHRYTEILGYSMDDLNSMKSEDFIELFHEEDRQMVIEHMSEVMKSKSPLSIEYRFRHKDGHWVWCYSMDSVIASNRDDKSHNFIGSFIDITQKKQMELQLLEAIEKVKQANQYKNNFLSNMSHEIRTPLSGILGFAELLRDNNLDSNERNRYINLIGSSSDQLLNLVNDIIDVTKIEAGELKLEYEPTHIPHLLDNLRETFDTIKKSHIEINASIAPGYEDLSILTDHNRLQQVLINLIKNAIKFTERGEVKFGFVVENQEIEFFVKDEGVGIPEDQIENIFNRYQQIDTTKTLNEDGKGLGLSISQGLVKMLGGELKVKSVVGQGSTFYFRFPFKKFNANIESNKQLDSANMVSEKGLKDTSILIAEDNAVLRSLYKAFFKNSEVKIDFATNGREAIDMYNASRDYQLVLMDIRMPDIDGVTAAEQILKQDPKAKIIAVTAQVLAHEVPKYYEVGFVNVLSKPITKTELLNEVLAHHA